MRVPDADEQLTSTPAHDARLDRLAHWIARKTETDYSVDQAAIAAEGVLIEDAHMEYVLRGSRWFGIIGTWKHFSGPGRLVITRQRLRAYNLANDAIVTIAFADPAWHRVTITRGDGHTLQLRVPHGMGENARYYVGLNRRLTITTKQVDAVYRALVDAHTLGQAAASRPVMSGP